MKLAPFDYVAPSTVDEAIELLASAGALAQRIIPQLEGGVEPKLEHDSSTNNLIRRYRKLKGSA